MRDKLIRFMQGRYGIDQFSKFLMYFGLFFMFISMMFRAVPDVSSILMYFGLFVVVFAYVRVFSKNIQQRTDENRWFLDRTSKLRGLFGGKGTNNSGSGSSQRSTFRKAGGGSSDASKASQAVRIFKCPSCKQKVRVPAGKGKIQITCPKCHVKFIKKT